jgi:predicted nuclease of predicted toxin-antitoxin system
MRVLLDECLPKRLKAHFAGHKVTTVPEAGWAGKKNGELLRVASGEFDAFITADSNLVHQQHLVGVPFIVIVLSARSNRLNDLLPLVPQILESLSEASPGHVVRVGG